MLQEFGIKFEQWLLPRSRMLLGGLLTGNVCLALFLNNGAQQTPTHTAVSVGNSPQIKLLAEVPAVAIAKAEPRECRLWGPESDPQIFAGLVAELDATGGFPEVQRTQIQGAPDYLVYIGELGSRDNAKRVSSELTALEIDSYVVMSDDALPILSVGVFSRKSLADKQLERISGLGYRAFIEHLERVQTVYRLSAHVSAGSDLHESSTSACLAFAHNP